MTSIPASKAAITALKVEQRVEQDVKAGIPELERSSHTESEESFRSYVTREIIGKVHRDRQAALDEESQARGDVKIRQLYQEIKGAGRVFDKQIGSRLSALVPELKRTAKDLAAARMDLEIFRHKNALTREAVYRESKVLHYSIVFFIVIFETALNSFFLSKGSEMGLVGGFFQAFIISLVNLGLAAFMAFALRNTFHINPLRKVFFFIVFLVVGAITAGFVLSVGHYREALEADPFTASSLAVQNLWHSPWSIRDFNSWVMVIVSCIAVILLIAKFFVADDRYPGYTSVTHRLKAAQVRWARGCTRAFDEVNEILEETQREISEKEQRIRAEHIAFKASVERSDDILREYDEDIVKAQDLLDELVRFYQSHSARIMNRRSAYFGELLRVEFDKLPKLNAVGVAQHKKDLTLFERMVESLDQEYEAALEVLGNSWDRVRDEIRAAIGAIERENGLSGL